MKKVTNTTARLITLNVGTLKTGVTRLRIEPGQTIMVDKEAELDLFKNDPWVKQVIKKGDLVVIDPAAKKTSEKPKEPKKAPPPPPKK